MTTLETTHPILANENFRYCVCFLKNSGEKIRAMRLLGDVTNLSAPRVIAWVNELKMPLGVSDEFLKAHKEEMAKLVEQ